MTLEEYDRKLKLYRGHLKSVSEEIAAIWLKATPAFLEWSLSSKKIGVKKMAYIVENMSASSQIAFIAWCSEAKRDKNQIDVKLMEMI